MITLGIGGIRLYTEATALQAISPPFQFKITTLTLGETPGLSIDANKVVQPTLPQKLFAMIPGPRPQMGARDVILQQG